MGLKTLSVRDAQMHRKLYVTAMSSQSPREGQDSGAGSKQEADASSLSEGEIFFSVTCHGTLHAL